MIKIISTLPKMIPKTFHFVWISPPGRRNEVKEVKDLIQDQQDLIHRWIRMHPGFSYTLWTDENSGNLLQKHTLWKKRFLQTQNVGSRSDILRYLILKTFGGIYVDMDCHCLKSIEPLLDQMEREKKQVGFPRDPTPGVYYSNFFIVSERNAKFWDTMEQQGLAATSSILDYIPVLNVYNQTGPILIDRVAKKHPDEILLIESQWCRRHCQRDARAYVIHTSEASWIPKPLLSARSLLDYITDNVTVDTVGAFVMIVALLVAVFFFFSKPKKTCLKESFGKNL